MEWRSKENIKKIQRINFYFWTNNELQTTKRNDVRFEKKKKTRKKEEKRRAKGKGKKIEKREKKWRGKPERKEKKKQKKEEDFLSFFDIDFIFFSRKNAQSKVSIVPYFGLTLQDLSFVVEGIFFSPPYLLVFFFLSLFYASFLLSSFLRLFFRSSFHFFRFFEELAFLFSSYFNDYFHKWTSSFLV